MTRTTKGPVGRVFRMFVGVAVLCFAVGTAALPAAAAPHFHQVRNRRRRFVHSWHGPRHRTITYFHRLRRQPRETSAELRAHRARLAERTSRTKLHEAKAALQARALRSGSIASAARAFEGTRYVFGGTSRSGFDCSGFTRYILSASAGVSLPRTAMQQYEYGRKVDLSKLQPGDLVFFRDTYKRGISHVGIYIGDGKFVHASDESEGVTVDSLSSSYYAAHFAGARQVVFDRNADER